MDYATTGLMQGKTILITGASAGIGKAIAARLSAAGARGITVVDIAQGDIVDQAIQAIEAEGAEVEWITGDVSDPAVVQDAVARTVARWGSLDVIVNNAGIAGKPGDGLLDATPKDVETIFKVNVNGVLWGIQAAAEKFLAKGQKGKIISASSIAGHDAFPQLGLYSATKFAVRALTQAAARELGPKGITVNAYCPGIMDTDMWELIDAGIGRTTGAKKRETFEAYCKTIALGRPQYPEDVAAYVSFLVGPDSDYMTGQAVLIDGGMVYR